MTETETEAETLERLERALQRIGELARRPLAADRSSSTDRQALLHSLDLLVDRLKTGLDSPPHEKPREYPEDDGVTE